MNDHSYLFRVSLLLAMAVAAGAGFGFAEPIEEPVSARYDDIGAVPGGAAGACTIIYYNLCSGWMRMLPTMGIGNKIGVVYDLASECTGGEEHECENIANYWYWYATGGAYGMFPNVSYSLFTVDENDCLVTGSGATAVVPMNGWNALPGLGSTTESRIALVATALGIIVKPITDDNVRNAAGGPACDGVGVGNGTSFRFRDTPGGPGICPPEVLADGLGPVNLLVRSVWNCPTATGVAGPQGATESSSWSELKRLFQ